MSSGKSWRCVVGVGAGAGAEAEVEVADEVDTDCGGGVATGLWRLVGTEGGWSSIRGDSEGRTLAGLSSLKLLLSSVKLNSLLFGGTIPGNGEGETRNGLLNLIPRNLNSTNHSTLLHKHKQPHRTKHHTHRTQPRKQLNISARTAVCSKKRARHGKREIRGKGCHAP
jgi:hypothetical protein